MSAKAACAAYQSPPPGLGDGSGLLLTVRCRQGLSLRTIAADGSRVAELPLALPAGWTTYAF